MDTSARTVTLVAVPPSIDLIPAPSEPSLLSYPELPTKAQLRAAIPKECFVRDPLRAWRSLAESIIITGSITYLGWRFIPLGWAWIPVWILYAMVAGTAAMGLWVIAHECGHRAFAAGTKLQDAIGFVAHSALLVPYFSWQRSHSIHHARTNHLTEGETHVPRQAASPEGRKSVAFQRRVGVKVHGALTLVSRLLFGWPIYLIFGTTGGPVRGKTNHFSPRSRLFPFRWRRRIHLSALGVVTVLALLVWWAVEAGSIAPVLALYVGPYVVVNAWLVTYTWLHHTDVDVPHLDDDDWSFVSGVFNTLDRPYGRTIDYLHHQIGSTHVVHHFDGRIPHYRARSATDAIAEAFPEHYRRDETSVFEALWRVSTQCHVVAPSEDGWRYEDPSSS